MIAKIGKGTNLYGALAYNIEKVENENGTVLHLNNMYENISGNYTITQLMRSFTMHLAANRNTEKPVLHISLNPDPNDLVNDESFCQLADNYMKEMGYGNQPYVIFKHTDIERAHIHIVSVCVDKQGKKINDSFEKVRSMAVCRKLENAFGLLPAIDKEDKQLKSLFNPLDFEKGNIKGQIGAVVKYLPNYYSFHNLGTYNALLSLFNISAEMVSASHNGQVKEGLVYFATNSDGDKVSNPFKSSLFGRYAGLEALRNHFSDAEDKMKESRARSSLQDTIIQAMHVTKNEFEFKKYLIDKGINTVIRRNEKRRLYGITFIDHESRSVWNGSQLGKNLSANKFHHLWEIKKEQMSVPEKKNLISDTVLVNTTRQNHNPVHPIFEFLNVGTIPTINDDFGWLNLLPEAQPVDFEEELFIKRNRKKKKARRGHR